MQKHYSYLTLLLLVSFSLTAQDVKRERPEGWDKLVFGGRFMDRFLPMPDGQLSSESWGAKQVQPRYVDNGIEDQTWSYWGGNIIKGKDDKYHLFVCRWRESAEKGHMEWPRSHVAHAIADNPIGPFHVLDSVGPGHNPEIHHLPNGQYFLYVNGGFYLSSSLNGPWEFNNFEYDQRERPIFDHTANNSFARREDGSYIMVGRGGEICFSQNGLPPYCQVSEKSVYPPFEGRYEDPVIWRTNIQYHMIVNDWLGRIAYYLRSKDGITWKLDAGEAYIPGIARHKNGTVENWYKFERIKVLQDEYGRAYQANFAVCDTSKHDDKGKDNHSSKNISIPLKVGRLISILNSEKFDKSTSEIQILLKAESDFNPHNDINIKSLRFGSPETVDFGGGCSVKRTQKLGKDLIIIFEAKENGITNNDFTAKLLGTDKNGELLFGYARLPWLNYNQPALSAKYPNLSINHQKLKVETEVQNFGQTGSMPTPIKIEYLNDGQWTTLCNGIVPRLLPFEKTTVTMDAKKFAGCGELAKVRVSIYPEEQNPVTLEGGVVLR